MTFMMVFWIAVLGAVVYAAVRLGSVRCARITSGQTSSLRTAMAR
jgi:hypothetical protein